jgi:uncharacterized protein YjbJ (UPF0337 family)
MDNDRIKGKVDDVAGRVKRQAGEWTGDKDLEAEGAGDQVKGKVQNTFGKVKDAARDVADRGRDNENVDRDIKKDDAA